MTELNIDARAFENGRVNLLPAFATRLAGLKPAQERKFVIRINYRAGQESAALIETRLSALKAQIASSFDAWPRDAQPTIEINTVREAGNAGQE